MLNSPAPAPAEAPEEPPTCNNFMIGAGACDWAAIG